MGNRSLAAHDISEKIPSKNDFPRLLFKTRDHQRCHHQSPHFTPHTTAEMSDAPIISSIAEEGDRSKKTPPQPEAPARALTRAELVAKMRAKKSVMEKQRLPKHSKLANKGRETMHEVEKALAKLAESDPEKAQMIFASAQSELEQGKPINPGELLKIVQSELAKANRN